MGCCCSHGILNLSRNRSVGKDLYKWKGIRLLQGHSYWAREEKSECVNVFKKVVAPSFKITVGKKRGLQFASKIERQGRTLVMILTLEVDLRSIQILLHFGVPPLLLLGQLKKYCNDCF